MTKDIQFLKKRSLEFFENALKLFEEGKYNLCAFNLEQSLQLFLKYLIGKRAGDWPKTHFLYELIDKLTEAYDNQKILKYKEEHELFFDDLSDAYFTSRYFPKEFDKNLTQSLLQEFKDFIKFIENELNEKFGDNK